MPLIFPVDFQYELAAVQKVRKFYKIVLAFDFFCIFSPVCYDSISPLSVLTLLIENYITITIICLRMDYGYGICSYNKEAIYKVITCSSDHGLVHWCGCTGGMAVA
jgi:hypothetical protein